MSFEDCDHIHAVFQVAQWDPFVSFAAAAFPCDQELMLLASVETIV